MGSQRGGHDCSNLAFKPKESDPKVTKLLNNVAMIITGAVRLPSCALSTLYTHGRRGDETECERRLDHGEVIRKGSFKYKIRLRKNIKKVLGGWWHI